MTAVLLTDVVRGCYHDGPGFRTVVNFKGCPLRCAWCHSPHTWSLSPILCHDKTRCIGCGSCVPECPEGAMSPPTDGGLTDVNFSICSSCMLCTAVCPTRSLHQIGETWEVEALLEEILRDKILFDKTGGGVTLSGGECLAQPRGAYELLWQLHERGVHNVVETCGAVSRKDLNRVIPVTDLFLFDVKVLNPEIHRRFTGISNKAILNNLQWLVRKNAPVQVRSPVVPGVNDYPEFETELRAFCEELEISQPEFLPFNIHAAERYEKIGTPFRYPRLVAELGGNKKRGNTQ